MGHRHSGDDKERLAAALRANLARRKAQARQRQEGVPERQAPPSAHAERAADPGTPSEVDEE
jgi:hypothetical protein